jgi:hypothetical protein
VVYGFIHHRTTFAPITDHLSVFRMESTRTEPGHVTRSYDI